MKTKILTFILFVLFLVLILFKIKSVPVSLTNDEVSEVYNSYSLLISGKDRYGESIPLTFRSFGTYLAPLYTYLTVLPVKYFGMNNLSARSVSLLFGFITLIVSYFIVKESSKDNKILLITIFVLSISPWLLFFTRSSTEVTLSLALFLLGVLFFVKSINSPKYYLFGSFLFGLSTHAYYSEKLIAPIFIFLFTLIFWKHFVKNIKYIIWGFVIFVLTQIPNLFIESSAITRRLSQTVDWNFYRIVARYVSYFSPKNLFFETDSQLVRSIPNLSVFYNWMIIPFGVGIAYLSKVKKTTFIKTLLLLLFISPIPASLTRDPFYTIRTLVFLWVISLIISLGSIDILRKIKSKLVIYFVIVAILFISLFSFAISYFSLFNYERSEVFGYQYLELSKKVGVNDNVLIDNSRDPSICLRMAYLNEYNPVDFQNQVGTKILKDYFQNFDIDENCQIGEINIRPIVWGEDIYKEQILVGDPLAISEEQVKEHKLKLLFEIKNKSGQVLLSGYKTSPDEKRLSLESKSLYYRK